MRKLYDEPEFEFVRFTLQEVMARASAEGDPNQGVGNGDPDYDGPIE